MSAILEVKNLKKKYEEVEAVKGISFKVEEGSFFSFLGQNGAGKSTTINIIATLLSKSGGEVTVCGLKVDESDDEIRQQIGVVFQESVLDVFLTVEENLRLRASFYNFTKQRTNVIIKELGDQLDIKDILKQKYGKLSGGQRRRVDIANALVNLPKLLILDEPTTGLDPQTRQEVWNVIKKLQIEKGITIFLTTHYMEETLESDRVVILEEGRIVAEGTPEELRMNYSKDTLILVPKDMKLLSKELHDNNVQFKLDRDRVKIDVADSLEALKLLNKLKNYIKFEVIGGSMDDVFIAVTTSQNGGN
jgi:ABC-type multidrug transport system ATPase subunit